MVVLPGINSNNFSSSIAGKTTCVLKGLEIPKGFIVTNQIKACVDTAIMVKWVKQIWLKYTGKEAALLILDSFKCHLVQEVNGAFQEGQTVTLVIPGGKISVLQPLDVCINKPLKATSEMSGCISCRTLWLNTKR